MDAGVWTVGQIYKTEWLDNPMVGGDLDGGPKYKERETERERVLKGEEFNFF